MGIEERLSEVEMKLRELWNRWMHASVDTGQVMYWDTGKTPTGSSSLYWNNTTNRLGIGNTSPGYDLTVGAMDGTVHSIDVMGGSTSASGASMAVFDSPAFGTTPLMQFGFPAGEGSSRNFCFQANATNILAVLGTGRVGVMNVGPGYPLDVTGDINSSTAIRQAGLQIYVPWTNYNPAWTAVTTNPVINNGTIAGRYCQVGKMVTASIVVTMGSSTTYGSGAWRLSLPVTATSGATLRDTFACLASDLSAGTGYTGIGQILTTTTVNIVGLNTTGYSATIPFTWATSDRLQMTIIYEAA